MSLKINRECPHTGTGCRASKIHMEQRTQSTYKPFTVNKMIVECHSHGGSRRFESCCAHHLFNNLEQTRRKATTPHHATLRLNYSINARSRDPRITGVSGSGLSAKRHSTT